MSFIRCSRCGRRLAATVRICPYCKLPATSGVASGAANGNVSIYTPQEIPGIPSIVLGRTRISIKVANQKWLGAFGGIAQFNIDAPSTVVIDMGSNVKLFTARISPNKSYAIRYLGTRFTLAQCDLIEI